MTEYLWVLDSWLDTIITGMPTTCTAVRLAAAKMKRDIQDNINFAFIVTF